MICKCGDILSITAVPNKVELTVFTDSEWIEFSETVYDKWDKMSFLEKDKLMIKCRERSVWYCNKCGRIYVFNRGNDVPVKIYTLEKDEKK